MITQAIKNWFRKLFSWIWNEPAEIEYSSVTSSLNAGTTQEQASHSVIDGAAPQTGIVPRLSTIENRPGRIVQPSLPPPGERIEAPFPLPSTTPVEKVNEVPVEDTADTPVIANSSSHALKQLEFLRYLVERGIVNEGFKDGYIPEQYRK